MHVETKEFCAVPGVTEFITVNTFDYDRLLSRIVKHSELGDTELSNVVIAKIFKDLAEAYNKNKRDQLSQEELSVAENFMKEFSGLRFADYEGEEAGEFFAAAAEAMEWSLQNFQEFLTGGISTDDVSEETNAFYMSLLELMDVESFLDDDDGEQAMLTMERLQEILDNYMTGEFNELQLSILSEIEKLLDPTEIITGILVTDERPGKTVKYGDSLVTFPTILIKATSYGH